MPDGQWKAGTKTLTGWSNPISDWIRSWGLTQPPPDPDEEQYGVTLLPEKDQVIFFNGDVGSYSWWKKLSSQEKAKWASSGIAINKAQGTVTFPSGKVRTIEAYKKMTAQQIAAETPQPVAPSTGIRPEFNKYLTSIASGEFAKIGGELTPEEQATLLQWGPEIRGVRKEAQAEKQWEIQQNALQALQQQRDDWIYSIVSGKPVRPQIDIGKLAGGDRQLEAALLKEQAAIGQEVAKINQSILQQKWASEYHPSTWTPTMYGATETDPGDPYYYAPGQMGSYEATQELKTGYRPAGGWAGMGRGRQRITGGSYGTDPYTEAALYSQETARINNEVRDKFNAFEGARQQILETTSPRDWVIREKAKIMDNPYAGYMARPLMTGGTGGIGRESMGEGGGSWQDYQANVEEMASPTGTITAGTNAPPSLYGQNIIPTGVTKFTQKGLGTFGTKVETPSAQGWAAAPWTVQQQLFGYLEGLGQQPSDLLAAMTRMQPNEPSRGAAWRPRLQYA